MSIKWLFEFTYIYLFISLFIIVVIFIVCNAFECLLGLAFPFHLFSFFTSLVLN